MKPGITVRAARDAIDGMLPRVTEPEHSPPPKSSGSIAIVRVVAFVFVVALAVRHGFAFDHWMPAIGEALRPLPIVIAALVAAELISYSDRCRASRSYWVLCVTRAFALGVGLGICGAVAACLTIESRIGAAERVGDRFLAQARMFRDEHGRWPSALAELGVEESQRHVGSFAVEYVVAGDEPDEPMVQFELRLTRSDWHLWPHWLMPSELVRQPSDAQWKYRRVY